MMFQFTFHDGKEVWCAIMPNVDDRTIVLENFRVVSVDDGTLSIPDPPPTLSALRLEKGTPVTIVSKQSHGTVVMLGAHNTVVQMEGTEGKCELVANTDLTYRMGTTIDKTLPPYRVVDGYLVPIEDSTHEAEDVVEAEVVEEVVQEEVTMDNISTPLTDTSYDAWNGKYLSEVASFAPDELLCTPNLKTHIINITVDHNLIYARNGNDDSLTRVTDTTNVFSNVSLPNIRQLNAGIVVPLMAYDGTRTAVTTGVGTHYIMHDCLHFTVMVVRDLDDWSREALEDMGKKYMTNGEELDATEPELDDWTRQALEEMCREPDATEPEQDMGDVEKEAGVVDRPLPRLHNVYDVQEEEEEDIIDRPPPRLHNVHDAVRVKPPAHRSRPFQGCTHPGCSKGLHHSGICDVMTWETRKRTATEHYTPAARTNVQSIDDSDDSDDDVPLSQWSIPRPVAKKRKPIGNMIGIHENHFPQGFRAAVMDKVAAISRGTVDSNGQRSFVGQTLQTNGGYYTQTKIGRRAGQNRYLGVFERSTVGAFAIVMARMFPEKFDTESPTATMRHWMEMMVNDVEVAEEWIANIKRGRMTRQIRIEELSDDE